MVLNDTCVLDVNANKWTWPKMNGIAPSARYGHSAILAGNRMMLFGGRGKDACYADLHALDPLTMHWMQGPEGAGAPSVRLDHSAT